MLSSIGPTRNSSTPLEHKIQYAALYLFLAILAGCAGNEGGGHNENEAAREILLAADRNFSRISLAQGAAEAFRAYLAEGALQLPNGAGPIEGRDAIVESLRSGGSYTLEWEPADGRVAKSGDLGYTWGYYTFRTMESGKEASRVGKYLNIWLKDTTGAWKVMVDMGNLGPAGN